MPDYAALKTAIAGLSPLPTGSAAIADALNAQTTQATVPFPWRAAKLITQISGSWANIVLRSRLTDGTPANKAAINAYEMDDGTMMLPSDAPAMATLTAGLAALQAVGDITTADVAEITALTAPQAVPVWVPPISENDVWVAQGQPE